ncbi:M56 family metallopeptidase [Oceanirhabdus sp. W0125-5]|uniref:M56 family metallopeptidase n=1 Tax=Oceanirhabdus sp. W0125-5 TaxID=2999116 RepID=UPI0022F2D56F|nr:M56 family metallopeptidase [Oceanirhabdus sp. W0125-5]WBW97412.1 M56 family metallopeptidase [Oceanirhabdus sp. W0125-5]
MTSLFLIILKLSIKASITLLVFLLLEKLLHNFLSPKVKYSMWILILIILSLPINIESKLSIYNLRSFFETQKSIELIGTNVLKENEFIHDNFVPKNNTTVPINKESVSNDEILKDTEVTKVYFKKNIFTLEFLLKISSIIWLLGFFSFITIYIIQLKKLNRIVKCQTKLNNESVSNILKDLKKELNISRTIKLYKTSEFSSPALTGIFKIKILLPDYLLDNLSNKDLRFIIYHELCHLKRLDNITNYIILFYKSLYWFNPLIHIMFRYMKRDMEISCDNLVLRYIPEKEHSNYGMTIINIVEKLSIKKHSYLATCLIEDKSEIVRRIKMIKKHNKFSKIASILTLSVMLLVGCSTASDSVKDSTVLSAKIENKNAQTNKNESGNNTENTNNESTEDKSTENTNEDKSTELTSDEAFEIASKAVKDYFDFDADKSSFDPTTIIDMGHYWILRVSNSQGSFQVRILLEDKQSFMISGSSSAAKKVEEEVKKAKNIDKVDNNNYSEYIKEYYDYLYSKEPISKEESKKMAEEFIKSSPLKDMNLSFSESESFYELKYDSPEKEFYVFAYLKDNSPQDIIFIKVNNYLKEVSELTL